MLSRRRETTWLWLIVIVGALVRLYHLDFQSLWLDEGWQYFMASAPTLRGVFERSLNPIAGHPPLSYFISHLFLQVHDSDFFLRLPSALFGIGTLPLCYLFVRRFTVTPVAVWTVAILALSPLHIWYSQEARLYTQLLFLSLLSTLCLCNAIERTQPRWWVLYIVIVTAGLYTHIFMAFSVLTHGLWTLLHHRRHVLAYSLSIAVVSTLFWVPMGPFLLESYKIYRLPSRVAGFSWGALPYTFFTYGAGFSLGPSIRELHEDRSVQFIVQFLPSILAVGTVFGTLFISGIWSSAKYLDTKYRTL